MTVMRTLNAAFQDVNIEEVVECTNAEKRKNKNQSWGYNLDSLSLAETNNNFNLVR